MLLHGLQGLHGELIQGPQSPGAAAERGSGRRRFPRRRC